MSQLIAKRYAKALFDLSDESYQIKKVAQDMELMDQCLLDSSDFQAFIKNTVLPRDRREIILKELFSKKIEEVTYEFLKLLLEKNRLNYLDLITAEFKNLVQKSQGVAHAEIISAEKLSADQIKIIKARLKKRLNKDVELSVSVDRCMLGGLKIQIEDQVFDYSLDTQLKSFKASVWKG